MNESTRLLNLKVGLCVALSFLASKVSNAQTAPTASPVTSTTPHSAPSGGRQAGATSAVDATAAQAQNTQSPNLQLASSQYFNLQGLSVEQLVETGFTRRADLLAARQRLAIAEGQVRQAGLRINPTLDAELGSPRFLAGEPEQDLSIGVAQVFETGGKRRKRVTVAQLELAQVRAEINNLERSFAADVRLSVARAAASARQLDTFEQLIAASDELVRVTNERVIEGDVAPLDLNLVKLETERLRAQTIAAQAELESELITLRAFVGFNPNEALSLAPLDVRPPRLELTLSWAK